MAYTDHSARRTTVSRASRDDPSALDEACFLSELRLSVEGARTAAEERLARRLPRWRDRLDEVCARLTR